MDCNLRVQGPFQWDQNEWTVIPLKKEAKRKKKIAKIKKLWTQSTKNSSAKLKKSKNKIISPYNKEKGCAMQYKCGQVRRGG